MSELAVAEERAVHRPFLYTLGAARTAHSGSTLLAHLEGVHAILGRWGCDEETRLLGLFHSVYGTQVFEAPRLSERETLAAQVGREIEALVYVYGAMRLDSFIASVVARRRSLFDRARGGRLHVTDPQMDRLAAVFAANAVEQAPRLPRERVDPDVGRFFERLVERVGPRAQVEIEQMLRAVT